MQDKDLAIAADEAVKQSPGGMPPMPQEEPPVVVPPHEPRQYDCDIVVLGGGGAGLVAAARISETTDKKVVVVEKRRNFGGGAMGAADWRVYGSRWQKDHGIPDNTMDALRKVMDETYWELNPALAYNTFKATGEFFDFLCDTGDGVEDLYKEGTYIFDGPDGPKIPAFKKERKGGAYVMKRMIELCEKNGVTMLKNTAVETVTHEGGVYTVTASDPGGVNTITARACILATGSWIRNHEMVAKYVPKIADMPMGDGGHTHPSYTGDAIAIAESLGAKIDYDSFEIRLMGPLGMCPSQTLMSMTAEPCALWINKDGKRWINETTQKRRGIFETGNRLAEQPGFQSFYIFDQGMIDQCVADFRAGKQYAWCFPAPPSYPEDVEKDLELAFQARGGGMPPMPEPKFFFTPNYDENGDLVVIGTEKLQPTLGCIIGKNATYLGGLTNTPAPTVNNGVWVSLKNGSTWTPAKTSYLTRLEVSADSRINGKVTVDGAEITVEPGKVYTGKIVVTA